MTAVLNETPVAVGGSGLEAERRTRAAAANRAFYRDAVVRYDSKEQCVVDPQARLLLRELIARALAPPTTTTPRVLDACGGSGTVGRVLIEHGVVPTVVDISPEMLSRWRETASEIEAEPPIVEAEITEFLDRDSREWDLIVFSSALHHIPDYLRVVALACRRLAPGGVFLSVFDPTRVGLAGRVLRRVDYATEMLSGDRRAFLRTLARKVRRTGSGEDNLGALAECHALTGVDDIAIQRELEVSGMDLVEHHRYIVARTAVVRAILRIGRQTSRFSFIARKPFVIA